MSSETSAPTHPLGELVEILSGFPFKSEGFSAASNEGTPLIRIRDLKTHAPSCSFVGEYDPSYLISGGDIIIGMDGEFTAVRWQGPRALLNQRVLKIRSSSADLLDDSYLFYRIQFDLAHLETVISGTTVKHLSVKDLRQLHWSLPTLDEQRRVAEVLISIGQALESANRVITKLDGLLVALRRSLTRDPEAAPDGVSGVSLQELCRPRQHPTISSQQLTETGFPAYGANGQIGFYTSYTHADPVIAITCRGATCGTINWIPAQSYVTGNAMALDDVRHDLVNERFLFHYLSAWGVAKSISGSAQPQITRQSLNGIQVFLPSLAEQHLVAGALDETLRQLDAASAAHSKLRVIGSQVASDLLSGRVRVPA